MEPAPWRDRQLLEAIVRNSPLAVVCTDLEGVVLAWNPAAERMFGWSEAEALGRPNPIVPPEKRAEYDRLRERVRHGEPYVSRELDRQRKDGSRLILNASSAPLYDADGGVIALLGMFEDVTEHRRAEERLAESESRLNTILDHVGAAIFIKDRGYRYTYVNQRVCEIFGAPRERIVGQGDEAFFSPASVEEVRRSDLPVIERGERVAREEPALTAADGLPHTYWTVKLPLRDGSGAISGLCGISTDISERKQAEQELAHMHELMQYVISHAQSAIAVHDRQLRYIYVSEQYLQQYQVRERDVIGRHHYDVFPDLPQKWRDVHQRVLAGAVEGRDEDPYVREDGTVDWTRWECRPWYERDGSIGGLIVYTEVITERKRREEQLRQSEEFVRTILDTVDEGFIVVDRDFRILTANAAFCALAGRRREEVVGRRCHEISHASDRPCHELGEECTVLEVFATGRPYAAVHRHRDRDGNLLFVETKGFPVKDAAGNVVSVIETINNTTERHLLEEERLKTQKLESIGTLAGGIAHDFNNLLQGIFGYIALAKMTHDQPERCLAMLAHAETALRQSVNLTTQLLTFSKGGQPVRKRTELLPVIENAVKFALSGSRSEHEICVDPGLWPVDADEGQLAQVIQNVALNADQAMPLGGSIAITARNLAAADEARPPSLRERDHVVIAIRDTGIGMPRETLGRIFDPYFTTKAKGSGLGLATSYSIIRNHEGLIEAQSEPGRGSTFLIYLPRSAAAAEERRRESAPTRKTGGRILVMDDERLIREVAGELLRTLGHAPTLAERGEAALEAYRGALVSGRPFDAVILDLTIRGGMGGEETLRRLREIDPRVKAVVSSGYADGAGLATYEQQGFKAFLKKPYRLEELQQTLGALLA